MDTLDHSLLDDEKFTFHPHNCLIYYVPATSVVLFFDTIIDRILSYF